MNLSLINSIIEPNQQNIKILEKKQNNNTLSLILSMKLFSFSGFSLTTYDKYSKDKKNTNSYIYIDNRKRYYKCS